MPCADSVPAAACTSRDAVGLRSVPTALGGTYRKLQVKRHHERCALIWLFLKRGTWDLALAGTSVSGLRCGDWLASRSGRMRRWIELAPLAFGRSFGCLLEASSLKVAQAPIGDSGSMRIRERCAMGDGSFMAWGSRPRGRVQCHPGNSVAALFGSTRLARASADRRHAPEAGRTSCRFSTGSTASS